MNVAAILAPSIRDNISLRVLAGTSVRYTNVSERTSVEENVVFVASDQKGEREPASPIRAWLANAVGGPERSELDSEAECFVHLRFQELYIREISFQELIF